MLLYLQIYQDLKSKQLSETFRKTITRRDGIRSFGGMSGISSEGTQHSYAGATTFVFLFIMAASFMELRLFFFLTLLAS